MSAAQSIVMQLPVGFYDLKPRKSIFKESSIMIPGEKKNPKQFFSILFGQ